MDESSDRLLKVKKSCNIAPGVVDVSAVEDENDIKGGISSNSKLSWVSCGPRITNLNNNNGSKKTGWTFGCASGDKSIRVVCVEELPGGATASPILVVGCESENGSSLCFYHSGCSRVLKAIHFNDKITTIAFVSKSNELEENLSELLQPWNGVVAVGTSVGKVYLVDVWWRALERCIEDYRHKLYDEQRQSKLAEITINDLESDIDCRTSSIRHGSSSLALWLNELTLEQGRVGAHPGLHNILGRMPLEFLAVSALKYFPQISTLAVGYNTSCFQLWDLSSLTLLYTSALLEAMLPVFSFSLLEPSDDPRYVCYLWSLHHSVDEDNIPFAGMYIISYHEKHQKQYSNQFFYEGFSSCSIRYQLDLGAEMADIASGRIISCQSIHRSTSKSSALWIQSETEETGAEEGTASLLSIVWEVWTPNQLSVYRKLTLFDLNQWYREYMPTSSDMEYAQFMAHFCLPDGQLLDVKVIPNSVKQFQALQTLDEHFYPTATSFDCLLLHQSQLMGCSHVGVQQEALEALTEAGPSGLLLPARLYKQCSQAGLRPLLVEMGSSTSLQSSDQRAYLLCVALEHEMTQFLRRCVADWADGSHAVAGCTLPGLLAWGWDRVQRYKKWLDRLCIPLFDYSGSALDTNDLGVFHHMICQLHRLRDLFHLILEKYSNCIIRGNFEQQYMVINLVTAFYDSVFWCVRNKVLPEVNANEANINGCIPYFTDRIMNSTISRRAELHQLAKSLRDPPPHPSLLLIDTVISQETGARVTDQWEREGGSATLGKYPPPSVQSLLRTYLIRGVRPDVKHFIVTYFLLDVAHVLCTLGASETTKQKLLKYPTDFGLTESQSKIVEAFWCLDHKQFQSGVELLLDGSVNKEDLQVYQHRTVLCLLAAVGEHKLALNYLTTRRRTPTEPQDIRMEMTLLLVNDLIHEAFQFQRHHQSMSSELLGQFFKGCVEMNKLDVIFKLALTPAEEEAFMAFLDKTSHPQADDLRVLYLLSRSRYVEAIDMNERLHSAVGVRRGMGLSPAPGSRNVSRNNKPPAKTLTTRDLIINSVSKSLPSITRDLADYCHREKHFSWKQINRPTPLSVVVHTDLSNDRLPFYKTSDSQLIQAAVSKTREIWAPLLATPAALKRKLQTTVEDTPFLRNPIHSRLNSSVTNSEEVRSGVRSRTDDEESKVPKRARLEFSPSEKGYTQPENILDKTAEMDITCLESSTVLHTPLVARIVKKPPREISTPQSILKGRSGPNTPLTPARERLGSPAVGRQIRFSLPPEETSPSPTKSLHSEEELHSRHSEEELHSGYSEEELHSGHSEEELHSGHSEEELHSDEGDYFKTTLSPRKSIHETSDLHSRLPTPANPRVLQKRLSRSLRSSVTRLQFDESESTPTEEVQPEPSATAVTLLKKISSSPPSSEEAYFSFQSSSSGVENKIDGVSKFKISYGLEGNIEDDEVVEDVQQDKTYTEENPDDSVESGVSEKEVEKNQMETTITPLKSRFSETASVGYANQTNESVHLTLEYKGDATSSSVHQISEHLSQSINKTQEMTHNDNDTMTMTHVIDNVEAVECEQVKSVKQNIEIDTEYKGNLDKKIMQVSTLPLIRGKKSNEQEMIIEEEILHEKAMQDSTLPLATTSKSVELEIETDTINVELDEEITPNSTVLLASSSESVPQEIKIEDSIIDKQIDDNVLPIQDSTLTSISSLKSLEQENEIHNVDGEGVESTMQDSTLRSVRGSTPLPQILEELVKKGRISLSVPESKNSNDSHRMSEEKYSSTEGNKHTINFPTCSISEELLSVEDIENEKLLVHPQEEKEGEYKSVSHTDETINTTTPEIDHVFKKSESFHVAANNSSFKQTFVFGNQASLSTCAANRNLTFNIGTNQFGSTTLEGPFETEELSSSKLDSSIRDKNETEPEPSGEEETPKTSNVTQTDTESQICSTSEEPTKPTEITNLSYILEAHPDDNRVITIDEFFGEEPPSNERIIENIVSANTAEISQVFNSDLPEGDQNQVLEFFVDTAGSSYTKPQEADSTADFELKMSEGESMMEISCYENNEVVAAEETEPQEEPVFQTLKPVEYQVEEGSAPAEDNRYDQFSEKEVVENEDEVDIYGDIDEVENGEDEEESVDRESENEQEEEKEVICLGSSSDEEPPTKLMKSSTPYSRQLTPKAIKQSKVLSETLDYELEEEDQEDEEYEEYVEEEEEEEGDDKNESYSSESYLDDDNEQLEKCEGDSKIEKKNLYFSSESDSDTSHRRRSWKDQRNQYDSDESLTKETITTDEDTVESPPFELIGQESQEDCKEKLETIIEETKDNSPEVTEATSSKSTLPEYHSAEEIVKETEKGNQEPYLKPDQYPAEKESYLLGAGIPEDVDIIKLAEENRQRHLETGSILDLKKRRSKRYSSATDLNESKKVKLRRRSSSLHDFMSAFIKETKSSSHLQPEKELAETNASNSVDVAQVSNSDLTTNELHVDSSSKNKPTLTTQPSTASELEFSETGSITSSLMPEIGSIVSNQTSACEFSISAVPKPFENLKRRGKSVASRLSSLHDISEEISDSPESFRCPPQITSFKKSLRRSVSTDQLAVSTQMDDSRTRRSSSVCRWSEYAKAHESEITSDTTDTTDIRSSLEDSCKPDSHPQSMWPVELQKIKNVNRKPKLRSSAGGYFNSFKVINCNDEEEGKALEDREAVVQQSESKEIQHYSTSILEDMVSEDNSNVVDSKFADIAYPSTGSSRWQRAQSEPSSISQTSTGNKRSRRSSSSIKINEYHKRILHRSSLRGKSIEPQEFKIIDSDAESPIETLPAGEKKEKEHVHQSVSSKENETETLRSDLANDQVEFSAETFEPVEAPETSSSTGANNRTRRGHSEPPAVENDVPKTRSRTRRSSFSHAIEKVHKLILPRHLRKSRASSFQPMEIVQSDEDKSFQKTPDKDKQDFETGLEQQSDKGIIETPVTSKKRGKPKKQQNQDNETAAEETKIKESSSPTQEDPQIANKTTQDYPQPPKKRGRAKNKPEEGLSHKVSTEFESDHHKKTVSESQLTRLQIEKQGTKSVKNTNQGVKSKDNEMHSDDEPLNSFKKIDSENHSKDKSVVTNKKSGPKKKKGKVDVDQNDIEALHSVNIDELEEHTTEKSGPRKKKVTNDDHTTPKKTLKRKNKDVATPPKEQSDSENVESSLTESQADEMTKPTKISKEQELLMLDSPARRTRRSMSRMSDTEILTPTTERPQRRTRRNSVMSDIGLSTPNKYAESEMSDASTEINVRLNTPTRRSTRRPSISVTPNTPDLIPEEFLMQRRLTRHQHSQLQKSFELSFAESPKLSRLEEVPEESVESNETSLTPVQSSKRNNKAAVSKSSKTKSSKK